MGVVFLGSWRRRDLGVELIALGIVLVLATLSWRMIHDVTGTVYLQTASQGDPPLESLAVPGPDPLPAVVSPNGRPSLLGHYGYFWSERAFHYRSMLMFTGKPGQDPGMLAHDTWQQHPDGVNAWREYTLLMEPVYGWLYRVFGDQARPPVEFLLILIPLLHVLLFPLLYGGARGLGAGRVASVLAVVFYAACPLGFQRLSGSLLLKEDFALLLLAGFLFAHVWSFRRPGWGAQVAAGLLLTLFLASWHLSQFLALAILIPAALYHLGAAQPDRRTPVVYGIAALVAGLTPSLWARIFLLGPVCAVMAAWLAAAWFAGRSRRFRLGIFLSLAIALGAASLLNRMFSGDYSHVMGLLVQKIRHGFVRPADPLALPFAVRIFWAPPFNSPTLAEIQAKLGWLALWIPVLSLWSAVALIRRRVSGQAAGLLACQLLMLAGYLLVERLGVVYLVFAALVMALMVGSLQQGLQDRGLSPGRNLAVVLVLFLVAPVMNLGGNLAPMRRISSDLRHGKVVRLSTNDQDKWADNTELMRWITANTPGPGSSMPGRPAAFLAEVGLSPTLLLYCQRPMALNSQFENAKIRDRYEEFLSLFYGDREQELADFLRRLDVSYLVIDRNMGALDGPGSLAWIAGVNGELDQKMVAVRMQFQPEALRRFRPVFDNARYRVLALDGHKTAGEVHSFSCWWNADQFTVRGGKLVDLAGDRQRLQTFLQAMSDLQSVQNSMLARVDNLHRQRRRPDLMTMQRSLVQARLDALVLPENRAQEARDQAGRLENAIAARLSEIEPETGRPLGEALGDLVGSPKRPRHGFLGWFAVVRGEPLHHAAAGQLLALDGRYAEAASQFRQAADFANDPTTGALPVNPDPMVRQLWLETAWWTLGSGQVALAADLARSYLAVLDPRGASAGDQVVQLLRKIGAASP